jgi:hypothetical protein
MFNVSEIENMMHILEEMVDEKLAVSLLQKFNELNSLQGKLALNFDQNLSHEEWKQEFDRVTEEMKKLIIEIRKYESK